MDKARAIELLGGTVTEAAAAIGITPSAVTQWPEVLPPRLVDRVHAAIARRTLPAEALGLTPPRRTREGGKVMQPVANGAPVRGPVRSALDALQIGAAATFARPNHIPRHRFQARVSATIQHVQRETGRVLRLRSYDAGVVVERKA